MISVQIVSEEDDGSKKVLGVLDIQNDEKADPEDPVQTYTFCLVDLPTTGRSRGRVAHDKRDYVWKLVARVLDQTGVKP